MAVKGSYRDSILLYKDHTAAMERTWELLPGLIGNMEGKEACLGTRDLMYLNVCRVLLPPKKQLNPKP